MTLSDISSIVGVISGLAVLGSLVYLSLQNRQLERNQRAMMNQGVIDRGSEDISFLAQPQLTQLESRVLASEKEFTPAEIRQLRLLLRKILIGGQDAFVQNNAGLIDRATYDNALGAVRVYMAQPVYRALWIRNKTSYAPELISLVDRIVDELPLARPVDAVAQFKANLAEVLR